MPFRRWLPAILCAILLTAPADVSAGQEQDKAAPARARQAYDRALELESQGNHAAALSLLWEASGLAPRDAEVQNRLGEALERIGALDAAVDAYRRALAEQPTLRKASNNLILALVKTGKGPEAVERARALVKEAPDDPDRRFTLGLAQSEQDLEGAIETFRKLLELDPRHALARYNLALVLRRADRLSEALVELERTLTNEPRPEAHYTMGVIYWHQGELDRAATSLRAAVAADPRYADAHYALGSVLKARRDWTGARRAFDEAERLRRRTELEHEAQVWTSVGIQKAGAGDLVGALGDLRRATSVYELYAPAHYQLGLVLERLGQHDAARSAFDRARQLNPSLVSPRNTR